MVEGAEPHRFDGVRRRCVGGDDGNGDVGSVCGCMQPGQDLETIHVRHPQVEQYSIGLVCCRGGQRFASGRGCQGLVPEIVNGLG